MMSVGI